MKIIVLNTKVDVTLGLLDDDGYVLQTQNINWDLNKLSPDVFDKLLQALQQTKESILQSLDKDPKVDD